MTTSPGHSKASATPYRPRFRISFFSPRRLGSWLFIGVLRVLGLLPLRVSRAAGSALGLLFYAANKKRRHIAGVNLRLCYPQWPETQRHALIRRHFVLFGQSITDLALIWWGREHRLERHIHYRGMEILDELLSQGRTVILLTGHFLGMDFGGIALSRRHPFVSMMKQLKDPVLNWFVWRGRSRFGVAMVDRSQGIRPLIRGTERMRLCYYIPDEDLGPSQSVFAPFFGVPTATIATLGRLARITDAVVVPCFARILPGAGGYEVSVLPPLADFPTGERDADAARMNAVIEQAVREMPEQYMWTFKLFKTRPPGEASPYA